MVREVLGLKEKHITVSLLNMGISNCLLIVFVYTRILVLFPVLVREANFYSVHHQLRDTKLIKLLRISHF